MRLDARRVPDIISLKETRNEVDPRLNSPCESQDGCRKAVKRGNYPYPSSFLAPLPAWPLKAACAKVLGAEAMQGRDVHESE